MVSTRSLSCTGPSLSSAVSPLVTCTWLSVCHFWYVLTRHASSVQFAGAVGLANCNGAPRLEFMAGRVNSSVPAPAGLISSPADTVDAILARMGDAGLSTDDVVALMASHSVGAQKNLDMVRALPTAYHRSFARLNACPL